MFLMNLSMLTPKVFFIVCPLLFLAGFIDAIAGGGALISIPAYLIAGIPIHTAIATNKLSASFGGSISTARFMKNGMINLRLGIPSVAVSILGSTIGANLSTTMNEAVMVKAMYVILPLSAFVVLNKSIFHDHPNQDLVINKKTFVIVMTVAFVMGVYDGFFGPGAGTLTIICFTVFGKMSINNANAQMRLINITSTVTALLVFLTKGQVAILLGIAAGICNMLGSWIGAGLVLTKGSRVVKPALLLILALLAVKMVGVY